MAARLPKITLHSQQGFLVEAHTSINHDATEGPLQVFTGSLPQGTKFLVDKISVEILVDEYVVVCDRLSHQTL